MGRSTEDWEKELEEKLAAVPEPTGFSVSDHYNALNDKKNILKEGDSEGITPLHKAAAKGDNAIFFTDLLAELWPKQKTSPLTIRDHAGKTPLHYATEQEGNLKVILGKLPESDIENLLSEKDEKGKTPLHYLAEHGRSEEMREILQLVPKEKRLELISAKDNEGQSLLHLEAASPNPGNLPDLLHLLPERDKFKALAEKDAKDTSVYKRATISANIHGIGSKQMRTNIHARIDFPGAISEKNKEIFIQEIGSLANLAEEHKKQHKIVEEERRTVTRTDQVKRETFLAGKEYNPMDARNISKIDLLSEEELTEANALAEAKKQRKESGLKESVEEEKEEHHLAVRKSELEKTARVLGVP